MKLLYFEYFTNIFSTCKKVSYITLYTFYKIQVLIKSEKCNDVIICINNAENEWLL